MQPSGGSGGGRGRRGGSKYLSFFRRILRELVRDSMAVVLRAGSRAIKEQRRRGLVGGFSSDEEGGSAVRGRRQFPSTVRKLCWNKAEKVPGRHPDRWRRDVAGNVVLRGLNGCEGALCFSFDHIVPYARGGRNTLDNCQILQTVPNIVKGCRTDLSTWDLMRASVPSNLSDRDMDAIELGLYGNVWRQESDGNERKKKPRFRLWKMRWPRGEEAPKADTQLSSSAPNQLGVNARLSTEPRQLGTDACSLLVRELFGGSGLAMQAKKRDGGDAHALTVGPSVDSSSYTSLASECHGADARCALACHDPRDDVCSRVDECSAEAEQGGGDALPQSPVQQLGADGSAAKASSLPGARVRTSSRLDETLPKPKATVVERQGYGEVEDARRGWSGRVCDVRWGRHPNNTADNHFGFGTCTVQ